MRYKLHLVLILTLSLVWLILPHAVALGATYYVYEGESINDAAALLQPGDTVLVREGIYRETVTVNVNGQPDNRITIKNYPGERPVVSGGDSITGWTKCDQTNCPELRDIDGILNPNYDDIYWAWLDAAYVSDIKNVKLYEDREPLFVSQIPDQSIAGMKDWSQYRIIPSENYGQGNYIIDTAFLTQASDDYWKGAFEETFLDAADVFRDRLEITGFNAAENKIILEPSGYSFGGVDRYAIINHPSILDKTGEYYYTTQPVGGRYKVFLWPNNPANLVDKISIAVRKRGFSLYNGDYVTIDGFEIAAIAKSGGEGGVVVTNAHYNLIVRNCIIHGVEGYTGIRVSNSNNDIIENNYVYDIQGTGISGSGYNLTVRNNTLERVFSSNIYYSKVIGGMIIDNYLGKALGAHNSGITMYTGCENILVARNIAAYTRFAGDSGYITKNITIYNNIFRGDGASSAATWGNIGGTIAFLGNTLLIDRDDPTKISIYGDYSGVSNLIIKNNIVNGMSTDARNRADRSHNLYTYGLPFSPSEGEFFEGNLSKIFVDPDDGDYHLRAGSPAIDNGTDVSAIIDSLGLRDRFPDFDFDVDIEGSSRTKSSGWDIGAYEYVPKQQDENDLDFEDIPDKTSIKCYNNVFDPTKGEEALIWVELPKPARVKINLYNTKGNKIRKLADEERDAETCRYYWDGKNDSGNVVGSGLYFVHIQAGDYKKTKKIVVVK